MNVKLCDRCYCIETQDNPIEDLITEEGYYTESVCSECMMYENKNTYD